VYYVLYPKTTYKIYNNRKYFIYLSTHCLISNRNIEHLTSWVALHHLQTTTPHNHLTNKEIVSCINLLESYTDLTFGYQNYLKWKVVNYEVVDPVKYYNFDVDTISI
jgi:hypothetical protein